MLSRIKIVECLSDMLVAVLSDVVTLYIGAAVDYKNRIGIGILLFPGDGRLEDYMDVDYDYYLSNDPPEITLIMGATTITDSYSSTGMLF